MLAVVPQSELLSTAVNIGGVAMLLSTGDPDFCHVLRNRYSGFLTSNEKCEITLDLEIVPVNFEDPDADIQVTQKNGQWMLSRGDFRAEWDSERQHCRIRQTASPHATDSVLRIVHSLVQATRKGFLLHAASAIRNGNAFLFAGESGAGKSTISGLAPADVTLLTDEISYVCRGAGGYVAFGTPFTGELAKAGENVRGPVKALYLLAKGTENRIDPAEPGTAMRSLLSNVLFFAKDEELVRSLFDSAFEFVRHVPVYKLTFVPDARVWELIG